MYSQYIRCWLTRYRFVGHKLGDGCWAQPKKALTRQGRHLIDAGRFGSG